MKYLEHEILEISPKKSVLIAASWILKQNVCNNFKDMLSPIPNWKGVMRSMGKCHTFQNLYLPQMAPVHVQCTLVPKWGKQGYISTPRGSVSTKVMKFVCAPMCGGLAHWEWCHKIAWDGGKGCTTGPHPRCEALVFLQVPLERWVIDTDVMASLLVLVMLCVSLPTMEKQSTLMECLVDHLSR